MNEMDDDNIDVDEMNTGWKSLLINAVDIIGWGCSIRDICYKASLLGTFGVRPQSPHNDYILQSDAVKGIKVTLIVSVSEKGTFLIGWRKENPGEPIIFWIPFGVGIIFGKEMIHAGGLGLVEEGNDVSQDYLLCCPRLHVYMSCELNSIPNDHICYGDPENDGVSYNERYLCPNIDDALKCCKMLASKDEAKCILSKEKKK